MKKLLALGVTVFLSVFVVLMEIDVDKGTSLTCNEPTEEQILGRGRDKYSVEESKKLMLQKDPVTDWTLVCTNYCYEWRVIKWMDYVTCVQTRVVRIEFL